MTLLDLITSPWAILPATFHQILELYNAHVRGPKLDLAALEAIRIESSSAKRNRVDGYTYIQSNVGVLELFGPMLKRATGITRACTDTTGTAQAIQSLRGLVNNPDVKGILLHIDSPGGSVDGTSDFAEEVVKARNVKPVYALADGTMASGAYWVGSAAEKVYIANPTTLVGSIGVVATHVDVSGAEAKEGIKTTEITAGTYKRVVSPYKPLSDEGRAYMQNVVDDIYKLFVDAVSTNRNVPVKQVLEQMADGRVFMGQKAVEAGLVDGVSSLDQLIAELSSEPRAKRRGAGVASSDDNNPNAKEATMLITREALAAMEGGQDLINALLAEGGAAAVTQIEAEVQDASKQAASAELERVKGCFDAALPGQEDLARQLAFDGKTQPGEAALAINKAARETSSDGLANLRNSAKYIPFGGEPGRDKMSDSKNTTNKEVMDLSSKISSLMAESASKGKVLTPSEALFLIEQEA